MSLNNVTQRRPRKSLLGTHRMKRESMLPTLSDTLYSIYEEKKDSRDDVLSIEETVPTEQLEENPNSFPTILNEEMTTKNSSLVLEKSPLCEELLDISLSKKLSPLKRRLDSIFSPKPVSNDDSFVIHETMLAIDESVLATSFDDNISQEMNINSADDVTALKDTSACNLMESGELVSGIKSCDVRDNETCYLVGRILSCMDRQIQEKSQFSIVCYGKITELQEKVDTLTAEIGNMRTIREFLSVKLPSKSAGKENQGNENIVPTLPVKITSYKEVPRILSENLKSSN